MLLSDVNYPLMAADINGISLLQVGPNGSTLAGASTPDSKTKMSLNAIMAPVADDLKTLNDNLHTVRPTTCSLLLVFLVSLA